MYYVFSISQAFSVVKDCTFYCQRTIFARVLYVGKCFCERASGFFKVIPALEFLPPSGCVQVSGNVTDNRVLIWCCFCAGHINHSIFWNNLAPPKVSISKDLDLLSGTSCLWAESQKTGSWIWPLTEVPANFAGGRRRATRRKSSISYWVTVWVLGYLIAKLSASGAGVQGSGWVVCLLCVCWNFDLPAYFVLRFWISSWVFLADGIFLGCLMLSFFSTSGWDWSWTQNCLK